MEKTAAANEEAPDDRAQGPRRGPWTEELLAAAAADGGEVLRHVLRDELGVFSAFVASVFENQQRDIFRLLAKEEEQLRDRYEQWTRMLSNRSRRVKRFLSTLLPNFSWEAYKRQRPSSSSLTSQLSGEGEFSAWRQENFLKLLFLEDEAAKLHDENAEAARNVAAQRRRRAEARNFHAEAAERLAQRNACLERRLQALTDERTRLAKTIEQLFAEYERGAAPTSTPASGYTRTQR